MATSYQLLVTLQYVEPSIWRRIQVDSTLKLSDLHKVLQTTMGWTDSHLHQFVHDGKNYTVRTPDNDYWIKGIDIDYKRVRLCDLLHKVKDSMVYEYDFGDNWQHSIVLEQMVQIPDAHFMPVCIGGAMRCPPEDVGGVGGYEDLLKIMKNPRHPEFKEYETWLGGSFQPESFDANDITNLLQRPNFGQLTWAEAIREQPFGASNNLRDRYEGYTAAEMNVLVGSPYSAASPIRLKSLTADVLANIPILNLSKFLMDSIHQTGDLKLTPLGSLPQKVVLAMYQTRFIPLSFEYPGTKRYREEDDKSFQFPRQLLEQSGLIKKQKNKLSLTQKGIKLMANDEQLFRHLLLTCSTKFDWSSLDLYDNDEIGCYGFAFVLKLLSVYGDEKRLLQFYAEKYLATYHWIVEPVFHPYFNSPSDYSSSCFTHRGLEILMCYFGFATIEKVRKQPYGFDEYLIRTELFDRVFEVR